MVYCIKFENVWSVILILSDTMNQLYFVKTFVRYFERVVGCLPNALMNAFSKLEFILLKKKNRNNCQMNVNSIN